jgi:hypothetical protein
MNAFFLFRYADKSNVHAERSSKEIDEFIFSLFIKPWEFFLSSEAVVSEDVDTKDRLLDIINHFIHNDDTLSAGLLIEAWSHYLTEHQKGTELHTELIRFYTAAKDRVCRKVSLEYWEEMLEDFSWANIPKEYHQDILLLTGYVYLMEDDRIVRRKCKQWLSQLLNDKTSPYHVLAIKYLMQYHLNTQDPDSDFEWSKLSDFLIQAGEREGTDAAWAHITAITRYIADMASVVMGKSDAVDIISSMNELARGTRKSLVTHCAMLLNALQYIVPVYQVVNDDFKAAVPGIGLKIYDRILKDLIPNIQNPAMQRRISILQAFLQLINHQNKEAIATLQDMMVYLRKQQCWKLYLRVNQFMLKYLIQHEGNEKAYRFLKNQFEVFKNDKLIRVTEPGIHLLGHMNDILLQEVRRPGITWAIPHIAEYFECHERFLIRLEESIDITGKHLFSKYQNLCLQLPEIAKHHVRTSVSIHKFQVQVMLLSLKFSRDTHAIEIGNQFMAAMHNGTSVLSLLNADWDDMKDVPFDIRNKLLNRSISITKGDLPLAAEHASFSYRNLRSYISLNEVNRLGFFLNEKATQSKNLEAGIRLMFHDLYLQGNIFEAVFDMPAFLVKVSQSGFVSEDMEEMLMIKASTAKKYIKIMCDIGIITPEKEQGRKLRYRLCIETIMNRYAEGKLSKKL